MRFFFRKSVCKFCCRGPASRSVLPARSQPSDPLFVATPHRTRRSMFSSCNCAPMAHRHTGPRHPANPKIPVITDNRHNETSQGSSTRSKRLSMVTHRFPPDIISRRYHAPTPMGHYAGVTPTDNAPEHFPARVFLCALSHSIQLRCRCDHSIQMYSDADLACRAADRVS